MRTLQSELKRLQKRGLVFNKPLNIKKLRDQLKVDLYKIYD